MKWTSFATTKSFLFKWTSIESNRALCVKRGVFIQGNLLTKGNRWSHLWLQTHTRFFAFLRAKTLQLAFSPYETNVKWDQRSLYCLQVTRLLGQTFPQCHLCLVGHQDPKHCWTSATVSRTWYIFPSSFTEPVLK